MSGYGYDARHMGNGGTAKIYWESDCGHNGEIVTGLTALAPLVRAARLDHNQQFPKCDMVDIERLETEDERYRRLKSEPRVVETHERWRLRNGSYAVVTERAGSIAAGHIEGSDQIHTWLNGKTRAGAGYDLVELEGTPNAK